MRKRWLVAVMAAMMALSMTGCKKEEVETPIDTGVVDSVDNSNNNVNQVVESTEDITEAVEETTGFVKVSDIKEQVLNDTVLQAQNSFRQLRLEAGLTDVSPDIAANRVELFNSLGVSEEDLLAIDNQEELEEFLLEKGLTLEQIYSYSIYLYLMDAASIGDDSEEPGKENFFTKTKELLAENNLDYDKLMNSREFTELKVLVEQAGLSLYDLNCKLWINDIFPGVNVDASELMTAKNPEDFLAVFTDAGLTVDDLSEKAAEPDKAAELLDTLKKIEEESLAEEEGLYGDRTGTASGTSGSGSSKDSIQESIENKEQETIPDNGGANSVTLVIGNTGGRVTTTADDDDDDSSNTSGKATIVVGDEEDTVKIVVKKILSGSSAESEIDASNSILPGRIDVDDDDDDFIWWAVKFGVKKDSSSKSDIADYSIKPLVRVKNLSGANIETVATRVFYIEPEETDDGTTYNDYWVAFRLPEEQSKFMLYFGDPSGSVYKFKSTALYDEDDD